MSAAYGLVQLGPNLFRHRDTANCYLIRSGGDATCIDFGDGSILDHLANIGVQRISDVVMTHHHRDVAQGLDRAVAHGARIWVPPSEQDLFAKVDEHWRTRPLDDMYDVRDDRFSLLEPVPIAGLVDEYRVRLYGGVALLAIPTPGHTYGSESYVTDLDGERIAFTGDLIRAAGKVQSLAATQWSYNGLEGAAVGICSGLDILDQSPTIILPGHGDPIEDPQGAIGLLNERLQGLLNLRVPEWQIDAVRAKPFVEISPHLLWNITSFSNSYVLLSDSGGALLFDYGYDFWPFITGFEFVNGSDRSSRRPWLQTLAALKRDYGIDRVEVAIPTHYHDDHVAGFNLLREVERTEIWAPSNVAPIFRQPLRYDLPCIWFDPIGVDQVLEFEKPLRWREYELTSHELPGHTLYAHATEFEVDGRRVLSTGDQQDFGWMAEGRNEYMGYNYRNRFRLDDYRRSAELYGRLAPDLMISGHWPPAVVTAELLERAMDGGRELAQLHRDLLALDEFDFGAEGFGARVEPYRSEITDRQSVLLDTTIKNPFNRRETASVRLVVPDGWAVAPAGHELALEALAEGVVTFEVSPSVGTSVRRARVGAELTIGDTRFGLQAEALISVSSGDQMA